MGGSCCCCCCLVWRFVSPMFFKVRTRSIDRMSSSKLVVPKILSRCSWVAGHAEAIVLTFVVTYGICCCCLVRRHVCHKRTVSHSAYIITWHSGPVCPVADQLWQRGLRVAAAAAAKVPRRRSSSMPTQTKHVSNGHRSAWRHWRRLDRDKSVESNYSTDDEWVDGARGWLVLAVAEG